MKSANDIDIDIALSGAATDKVVLSCVKSNWKAIEENVLEQLQNSSLAKMRVSDKTCQKARFFTELLVVLEVTTALLAVALLFIFDFFFTSLVIGIVLFDLVIGLMVICESKSLESLLHRKSMLFWPFFMLNSFLVKKLVNEASFMTDNEPKFIPAPFLEEMLKRATNIEKESKFLHVSAVKNFSSCSGACIGVELFVSIV